MLTKIDLLPYLDDVSVAAIRDALARVMPKPRMIELSARRGSGLGEWIAWLEAERAATVGGATRGARALTVSCAVRAPYREGAQELRV